MSILATYNRLSGGHREIIVDIRTTGEKPADGHSIIEVSAVEVRGKRPTGVEFYALVNPQRDVPKDVMKANSFSSEKIANARSFADVAAQLRRFIGGSPVLVLGRVKNTACLEADFLNKEMVHADQPALQAHQVTNLRNWSETVFGEKNATLDKLLDKYEIDRKEREEDGRPSLADARLIAEFYRRLFKDYCAKTSPAPAPSGKPGTNNAMPLV